ncbi:MAG: adenylate/guanylate cyclase domain-containing protein, partial [Cyclobacteriaceae bacterium]
FKAGINGGEITVAEVGDIKREIAYHGDVINTASRIQGQCNVYHKRLLISGDFLARIPNLGIYETEFLGEIPLRGKKSKVDIFSVEEPQSAEDQHLSQKKEMKRATREILTRS